MENQRRFKMGDVPEKVTEMAKGLGDALIERVKGYLKDEADTEFLKEMALELAQLQYQAMTATTEVEKAQARKDIEFTHARINTFIARQAIMIHSESQAVFQEILRTVGDVVTVLAKAALAAVLPS